MIWRIWCLHLMSVRSLDLASTNGLRSLYWLYDMTEAYGTVVWCAIVYSQWEEGTQSQCECTPTLTALLWPSMVSLSLSLVVLISESNPSFISAMYLWAAPRPLHPASAIAHGQSLHQYAPCFGLTPLWASYYIKPKLSWRIQDLSCTECSIVAMLNKVPESAIPNS